MEKPIVRAIDVGYGNTKFVVLRQGAGEIHCGLFPSIAPQASPGISECSVPLATS